MKRINWDEVQVNPGIAEKCFFEAEQIGPGKADSGVCKKYFFEAEDRKSTRRIHRRPQLTILIIMLLVEKLNQSQQLRIGNLTSLLVQQ